MESVGSNQRMVMEKHEMKNDKLRKTKNCKKHVSCVTNHNVSRKDANTGKLGKHAAITHSAVSDE